MFILNCRNTLRVSAKITKQTSSPRLLLNDNVLLPCTLLISWLSELVMKRCVHLLIGKSAVLICDHCE